MDIEGLLSSWHNILYILFIGRSLPIAATLMIYLQKGTLERNTLFAKSFNKTEKGISITRTKTRKPEAHQLGFSIIQQ